jgi:hypothetical protein
MTARFSAVHPAARRGKRKISLKNPFSTTLDFVLSIKTSTHYFRLSHTELLYMTQNKQLQATEARGFPLRRAVSKIQDLRTEVEVVVRHRI